VLERGRIGERWKSERWDGLKFQFPNWSVRLPDFPFPHSDPDGFADLGTIVAFLDAYAAFVAPPIRCGVHVTKLSHDGANFLAETPDGAIAARNVIVATGPYQRALRSSPFADTGLFQVHASHYRNPAQLPDGPVLVVGAGGWVAPRGEMKLSPVISGAYGGHTGDFRRFAAEAIVPLGRVTDVAGHVAGIAP